MSLSSFSKTLTGNSLESEVSKVLNSLFAADKEFTAHEVTREIRNRLGPSVEVVHGDVRNTVHKLMTTNISYENFDKDFGNGTRAMAYRPKTGVASKQKKTQPHVKWPKSNVALGGLPIKVTGTLSVANSANKNGDIFVYPKSEGRVTVPASALKKIGAKPGSKVSLTKANGHITIFNDGGKFGHDRHTVDKHTSIRIRKHRVEGFKRFNVSVKDGVIYLDGEK